MKESRLPLCLLLYLVTYCNKDKFNSFCYSELRTGSLSYSPIGPPTHPSKLSPPLIQHHRPIAIMSNFLLTGYGCNNVLVTHASGNPFLPAQNDTLVGNVALLYQRGKPVVLVWECSLCPANAARGDAYANVIAPQSPQQPEALFHRYVFSAFHDISFQQNFFVFILYYVQYCHSQHVATGPMRKVLCCHHLEF